LEVGTGTSQLWDRPAHDYTTLKMRRLQAGSIDTHTIDIHIKNVHLELLDKCILSPSHFERRDVALVKDHSKDLRTFGPRYVCKIEILWKKILHFLCRMLAFSQ